MTSAVVSDGLRRLQTLATDQMLVLSNPHLGKEHNAMTGRPARAEGVFADILCNRPLEAHDPSALQLVLSGDTFDSLWITSSRGECPE